MLRFVSRLSLLVVVCALLAAIASAQQTSKVTLESSETVFSVLAAMNTCGYDEDLAGSEPAREQVRAEVARAVQGSERARASVEQLCVYYRDHQQGSAARDLAQYVSLALNIGEPPAFAPSAREADMPPDASYVLGFLPYLQRFYINTDLHKIWLHHQAEYEGLIERFHEPLSKMLLSTDVYLRLPVTGYLGRKLTVFLEPLAAPGQVNSRNYGTDFFMVVSPEHGALRTESIRHTYLHFTLDPLVAKRATTLKRLEPLLDSVKTAPMDEAFKNDITLMVTESLIRAVEARTNVAGKSKDAEAKRDLMAQKAAEEGFILTPYFEQRLADFEKAPEGLRDAFPDWMAGIEVDHERKRAANVVFAKAATPEALSAPSRPKTASLLDQSENRLAAGDIKRARELAQQALDEKAEDPARALFILAQVATRDRDMEGAVTYFERTLTVAHEPRLLAWSHIYLGRICDLKAERETALQHYHAALEAGDTNPITRAAAERGIQQPYEPPSGHNQEPQPKE